MDVRKAFKTQPLEFKTSPLLPHSLTFLTFLIPLTPTSYPSMLVTTFAPWRAHQPSNAADDLIVHLQQQQQIPVGTTVLRHIPVSFELAPIRVIAKVAELRPSVVVCCGMAEGRTHLNLERYGKRDDLAVPTSLPLEALMADTHLTVISDCAGTYVCNHLYYRVLGAIAQHHWPVQALFVHIPPLTPATRPIFAHDLALILKRLTLLASRSA